MGPATNNYLLVERAQVARRDDGGSAQRCSEVSGGAAGRHGAGSERPGSSLSRHDPAQQPHETGPEEETTVTAAAAAGAPTGLVVPPPPSADVELWRRWWTSLPEEEDTAAPLDAHALKLNQNKAATVALRKVRLFRPQTPKVSFRPSYHTGSLKGTKKLAFRLGIYDTMDSISLRSGGERSIKDSDAESDADSELYGFKPPDGILPLPNMMRNRLPRKSFFEAEDFPFGGAIAEGEANAGVVYSFMPIDVAKRNSNRRSIRTPLSKNLFRRSNDSGIDRGEGRFFRSRYSPPSELLSS